MEQFASAVQAGVSAEDGKVDFVAAEDEVDIVFLAALLSAFAGILETLAEMRRR